MSRHQYPIRRENGLQMSKPFIACGSQNPHTDLCRGTGLYFRALLGGLSQMPEVPADVREHWRNRMSEEGAEALHSALTELDPEIAATLRPTDSQRIVRALEVFEGTGKSLLHWQKNTGTALVDDASATKIVLLPDRKWLGERIAQRFNLMWDHGALDEVRC